MITAKKNKRRKAKMLAAKRELRKEREFLKYRDLARNIAGKFSRKFNKPYQELMEVAEYALCLELFGRRGFDENAGTKKSTWLYTVIYFHLTQVCTRGLHPCPRYAGSLQVQIREWVPEIPFSCIKEKDTGKLDPEEKPSRVSRIIAELGQEAQALVRIVLEAPDELRDVVAPTPRGIKFAREAVRAYMIDTLDWTSSQVDRAWEEVQECLV